MDAISEIERLLSKVDSGELPPDEPIFVLRARDLLAAEKVAEWAECARNSGAPAAKCDEAVDIAARMQAWPVKQVPGLDDTRTGAPPASALSEFPSIGREQAVVLLQALTYYVSLGVDADGAEVLEPDASRFWFAARAIDPELQTYIAAYGAAPTIPGDSAAGKLRRRLARFLLTWSASLVLSVQ